MDNIINQKNVSDLERLISIFLSSAHEDDDDYMKAACNIISIGQEGFEYLFAHLLEFDEHRKRASIFALASGNIHRIELINSFKELLHDNHDLIVSEAIDGIAKLGTADDWEVVKNFLNHSSPYVRGAVIRFARKRLEKNISFEILTKLLDDKHFIVIENAIDELGELGLKEAIPYIDKFINYHHADVRDAAKSALKSLRENS